MRRRNSLTIAAIVCSLGVANAATTNTEEKAPRIVLTRGYEFRPAGYSLRYILPAGTYRRVCSEGSYHRADKFVRREEIFRETAFSSEFVRGGLAISGRPGVASLYVIGPQQTVIRHELPADFVRGSGRLWYFAR